MPPSLYIFLMMWAVDYLFISWVIRRVFNTSKGHEMNPLIMAAIDPLKEEFSVGVSIR